MAKTDDKALTEAELDRLLANTDAAVPSETLMARVMADADAVLAERRVKPVIAPRRPLRDFLGAIGGWPAIAGLASAAVAGIWIGYAQPGSLSSIADGVWATESGFDLGDFMPGYDTLLVEG